MHILDLIPEGCHQILNSFLFFHQLVSKTGCVNDSEPLLVAVPQPVALVCTGGLSDAVQAAIHTEAAILELSPFIILISPKKNICQARLANPCSSKNDNTRAWEAILIVA